MHLLLYHASGNHGAFLQTFQHDFLNFGIFADGSAAQFSLNFIYFLNLSPNNAKLTSFFLRTYIKVSGLFVSLPQPQINFM